MLKKDIRIGGHYTAKVSGKLVTVRVDAIRDRQSYRSNSPNTPTLLYDVTNLATGRKTTFRSAVKFREAVRSLDRAAVEGEQSLPPSQPEVRPTSPPQPTEPTGTQAAASATAAERPEVKAPLLPTRYVPQALRPLGTGDHGGVK